MADEPSEEAKNEPKEEEKQQIKEPSNIGLHDFFNLKQLSPNIYDLRSTEQYKKSHVNEAGNIPDPMVYSCSISIPYFQDYSIIHNL